MKFSLFAGDIADAEADAVCTSTNGRLSLVMGTGAAIRNRGGFEILRACEEIVRSKEPQKLEPGSAYVTTAGSLPHKIVIHCVASDAAHRSSDAIIDACVTSALLRADEHGCKSVAMPIFGTGHAHAAFAAAVTTMAASLGRAVTSVEKVTLVVLDADLAQTAQKILNVPIVTSEEELAPASSWLSDDDDSRW